MAQAGRKVSHFLPASQAHSRADEFLLLLSPRLSLPFFLFPGFHIAQDSFEWSNVSVAVPSSRSEFSNLESHISRARGDFPLTKTFSS